MPSSLRSRSIRSLFWSLGENVGVAALSLVSFVVLARLLDPADFGVVAMASVFVICFNLLISSALADGIIQRPTLGADHLDSAFWATLAIALVLAAICAFGGGLAAVAFDEPELARVLPWLAIVPLASGLGAIPIAAQRRRLQFRGPALCSLVGRVSGVVVALAMAFTGWGLWSLVGQQVVAAVVTNVGAFAISGWRPRLKLHFVSVRELLGFGAPISASQVVSAAGEQIIVMLVGILFGTTLLGYFTIAWRMVQLVKALVIGTVYHVAFSAFARLQTDRPALTRAFVHATQLSCLIGFPIGIGMAAVAQPAVIVLFGERWLPSIELFALLALEMVPAFYVLFFSSCFRALGRPGWTLGLALAYFGLGLAGAAAVADFGLEAVAVVWVAKSLLMVPVLLYLMRRLIGVSIGALLAPAIGPLLAAGAMALGVQLVLFGIEGHLTPAAQLGVAIAAGVGIYGIAVLLLARGPAQSAWRAMRGMASTTPSLEPASERPAA